MSQADITETETELNEWFSNCMQISNTTENYCYIQLNLNTMRAFRVSGSSTFFETCVLRQHSGLTHIAYNDIALYSDIAYTYGGKVVDRYRISVYPP